MFLYWTALKWQPGYILATCMRWAAEFLSSTLTYISTSGVKPYIVLSLPIRAAMSKSVSCQPESMIGQPPSDVTTNSNESSSRSTIAAVSVAHQQPHQLRRLKSINSLNVLKSFNFCRYIHFLLVTNTNLGPISHRFRYTMASFPLKNAHFSSIQPHFENVFLALDR